MSVPWFIGDELTGAGFRLAGARVWLIEAAERDTIEGIFDRGLADAPLVVITTTAAALLPEQKLAGAVRSANPPVAVVPDARSTLPLPDMRHRVRSALGVDS